MGNVLHARGRTGDSTLSGLQHKIIEIKQLTLQETWMPGVTL